MTKKNHVGYWQIALAFFLFLSPRMFSQPVKLPFYRAAEFQGVDYHSFYPQLMLAHKIGRYRKLPKNPVLTPSRQGWDSRDVADPYILVTADSIMLFYDGDNDDHYHIGYAVRDKQGWNWVKQGKIFAGSGSGWDAYHQVAPVILETPQSRRLYYNGNNEDNELGYQWGMTVLTSSGNRWKSRTDAPLLPLDTTRWDGSGMVYGDIIYFPEKNLFRMWYTGFQGPLSAIGLAESSDGIHWQRVGDSPVLSLLPGVIAPEVVFNGESYLMYFVQLDVSSGGMKTFISRAASRDGIHWQNITPILQPEFKWEGNRLMRPNLSFFEQRVQLYYCAQKGGKWHIGVAYANAIFRSNGYWRSEPVEEAVSEIRLKYERPAGTTLLVRLNDHTHHRSFDFSLDKPGRQLRQGVEEAVIKVPLALIPGEWDIEIRLSTSQTNHSPVIYSLLLVP